MPTIYERKSSRFLTKELVGKGMLVTIKGWHEDEVGNPPEQKDILDFAETDKGLVLNDTKKDTVAAVTGIIEMNDWAGKQIVLFHDVTIRFGNKIGGIGIRAPRFAPAPTPPGPRPSAPKPAPARPAPVPVPMAQGFEEPDTPPEGDDVPF
jgi:hypothetical protein